MLGANGNSSIGSQCASRCSWPGSSGTATPCDPLGMHRRAACQHHPRRHPHWGAQPGCRSGGGACQPRPKSLPTSTAGPSGGGPLSSSGRPLAVLDVEYTHLQLADGTTIAAAAWVALLDRSGTVLLDSRCKPHVAGVARVVGGVPAAEYASAPPVAEVAAQLRALVEGGGRLLVGHGLTQDLAALGLDQAISREQRYDTIAFPGFQNGAGNARSLAVLAARHLGQQQLQPRGQRHDARADAAAVLQLYLVCVEPALAPYEERVAALTAQMLAAAAAARAEAEEAQREH